MTDRRERSARLRRGLRRLRRFAIHLTPGFYAIGWGYHIDASMVEVSRPHHDRIDRMHRRDGRGLSAAERESWRALERSLRSTR
ncbi:hypothetical protein DFR70_111136 [Nocardia tenerifensis]|uniref:Uncharacterized protein n=1 Tax=Nocardia tenerifensis TaxID=228006 RepID=A0A318KH81_9NOCA|nr:hypothetical protein [Nocardia tenerifensis]PXX59752.1 hypothetical protein DFR70_111136 [Nocardia tenerifensis]